MPNERSSLKSNINFADQGQITEVKYIQSKKSLVLRFIEMYLQ